MLRAFVYIVLDNFSQKIFELNNCVTILPVSNPKFKGVRVISQRSRFGKWQSPNEVCLPQEQDFPCEQLHRRGSTSPEEKVMYFLWKQGRGLFIQRDRLGTVPEVERMSTGARRKIITLIS